MSESPQQRVVIDAIEGVQTCCTPVTRVRAEDVMLGLKHLSISTLAPPKHLVSNVSGFVVKGGITAVLGPSSSGKSLLMKVLTGRLPTLHCSGEVILAGKKINPHSQGNGFGFVSQEDTLIGDMTVRETLETAARLRKNQSLKDTASDAEEVIKCLGLGKVADNVVGTVLKRGLSGGEKRRCSLGQELVVHQAMAFLDEPTSGLDGTAAFDVIKTIKGFADSSKGTFSVMLSIHQPNLRILNLFNHILLLGGGGSVFFGSMPEAVTHFSAIGHPPPPGQVPTDFFMQVADSSFSLTNTQGTNFVQKFTTSSTNMATVKAVDDSVVVSTFALLLEGQEEKPSGTTFWRQFTTLTKRDALLATRDPTLYYLQFVLHVVYGFLIGATFHHVPTVLDDRASLPAASCLWILMLQSYIHVFKVFYLVASNKRFEHERANGSYGVMAYFLSELFVTAMAQLIWIPGVTVAFFLVGFPSSVYPFAILAAYSMALAAESMLNLITKFNHDASKAVVLSQAALVILTVFGGGMFRPYDEFPSYWNWLKELAIFTQGSKAMMLAVFEELTFLCPAESVTADSMCMGISNVYACTTDPVTEECQVDGLTVLDTEAGGLSGNKWEFLGYLALLFLVFRLSILFLYWYPWDMLALNLKNWAAPYTVAITLQHEMEIRRLWGQVSEISEISGGPNHAIGTEEETATDADVEAQHEEWEISGVNQSLLQKGSNFVGMEKTELVFQDVTVRLPKGGKVLIDSVSGMARSGHVLALMGPSGAGKTTLLNALSGRAVYASVEGSVALGAVGAEAKRALTPGELDYVPQFDDLNEHFTPRELLTYMNRLKQNKPARDSKCQVIELLYILGLVQKADQAVKTLSGGEKKRLSIAMGMVAAPRVLFLDEPTTGLDSAAAYSVVGYISKVARETNVVCIMTIHQPAGEVFNQLEDLMLLEEGHQAYFGGITRARDFFTSVAGPCPPQSNPADVYLDLISEPPVLNGGGRPTTWKELYRSSEFFVPVPEAKPSPASSRAGADGSEDGSPGKLSRLITVTRQMVEYYWRNTAVHWLRLGELAVLALYTGTMFLRLDSSQISEFSAAVFFNVWLVLFAVIAAVPTFVKDRRIALQEMLNGAYSPSTYCLGQFIASIPFTLLSAIIFQSIFHWLVGLNDSFEPFIYTIFLTAGLLLMMEAIMLLVVETLKNAMLACTFSMVVLGMLFLFAGFFVKVSDITDSISWLAWAIPSKYAFEGYLYMVFHGQEYDTSYGTVSGDAILKGQFAQGPDVNAWGDFGVILAYVLLFRLAHYGIINTGLKPYRNAMSRF